MTLNMCSAPRIEPLGSEDPEPTAANRIVDRVLQIFGGRGYMRENVAERFFRELRVDRIWESTSEIQRLIIARNLLKRGLDEM